NDNPRTDANDIARADATDIPTTGTTAIPRTEAIDVPPTDGTDIPRIRWFELTHTGFTLHATPLDVAGPLADYRAQSGAAWVFTSATLAVAGSFDHFAAQVGLEEPTT